MLERLTQAAAVGGQQVGVGQHGVVLGRFDVRVAQRLAILRQRPAAVAGADLFFEAHQRIEILRAHQRPRQFQRQRQRHLDHGHSKCQLLFVGHIERFTHGHSGTFVDLRADGGINGIIRAQLDRSAHERQHSR